MSDENKPVDPTTPEVLPTEPVKKPRKERRLRWRERQFVETYVATGDHRKALEAGNYSLRGKSPAEAAWDIKNRPVVQRAIEQAFAEKFPDANRKILERIEELLNMPIKGHNGDVGISPADLLKTADLVNKMKGNYAPTETHSKKLVAKVTTPLGTLGGDDGEKS
jgi:hypothetical protein